MKILFRVDAYREIGTGHLMRCLALAAAWRDAGGEACFATHCPTAGLLDKISTEGFPVHEISAPGMLGKTLEVIRAENPSWVVLDGYQFDTPFQRAVRELGPRVLVYDDYAHLDHYECDILVNQNFGSGRIHYRHSPGTRVMAGAEYAAIRRPFHECGGEPHAIPEQGLRLLVTLGGSDPGNTTARILDACSRLPPEASIRIVIGAANPHRDELGERARSMDQNVEILCNVPDMQRLMLWADLAISAGGITAWEVLYMKLPAIFVSIAENQAPAVTALQEAGFLCFDCTEGVDLDELARVVERLMHSQARRAELSALAGRIVDGKGTSRIIQAIEGFPLRVLFLGGEQRSALADWLVQQGEEVHYTHERLDADSARSLSPDIIVSYSYRHILRKDVFDIPPLGALNLHISYLPFNRGADPNPWSYIDNTPKGVTIHYIDEGVDTGDVVVQEEVSIDPERETLRSSYALLHERIQALFRERWGAMRLGRGGRTKQPDGGTNHWSSDNRRFMHIIDTYGWDIPIAVFLREALSSSERGADE